MIALLGLMAVLQAGNDPQWIMGRIQDRDAAAAFLSWDYSAVILRATCRNGEVMIDYYGDGVVQRDAPETTLYVDEAAFEMRRTGVAQYVLDDASVVALENGRWVEFDAPNEMEEPWYLGEAHALKTVAATCAESAK